MVWWKETRNETRRAREDTGLPQVKTSLAKRHSGPHDLELQAYDPLLVPKLDWGSRRPLVGFLTMDDELRGALDDTGLDPELETGWTRVIRRCSSGSAACLCRTPRTLSR